MIGNRRLRWILLLALVLLPTVVDAGEEMAGDDPGPWVVRVHTRDPVVVAFVAEWNEHFGHYPEKGILLLHVDREGYERLLARGLEVEVDGPRTSTLRDGSRGGDSTSGGIPGFPCYRTVSETFASAEALAVANPGLVEWLDIGDSWEKTQPGPEGHDLRVLRLTNADTAGPKPKLFVNTALHPREYATAELATRFAEYLVSRYPSDPEVNWLLDHHEIHLLLIANPDGREMAETDLSWRKNTDNDFCSDTTSRGVDLNRNFEFQWNCCGGSSGAECSQTYRGPAATSEPESQAIQGHIEAIFPDQRPDDLVTPAPAAATGVFLDVHAFGEDVLWSWGFTTTPPPNNDALYTLGRKYGYFTGYRPQHGSLSTVDGATKDFSYGKLGVPGFTIELGTTFFESCGAFEAMIEPDNLEALMYMAKVVRTPYVTPSGPDSLELSIAAGPFEPGDPILVTAVIDDTRFSDANGIEPTQDIAEAELYLGDPPWAPGAVPVPMTAQDGVFDEKVEQVEAAIDTSTLGSGRHLVFVRGRDREAVWGPVSAAYLYLIDPAASPVFEGFVHDAETGDPLGAEVSVGPFSTQTTRGGSYELRIPAGTYDLLAVVDGYQPQSVLGVEGGDLETVRTDFDLRAWSIVFEDEVEAGIQGWLADFPWAITEGRASSPTHSWTDSPGGDYANGIDLSLTSASMDLSGLEGVELVFRHLYDLERGFDFGFLETSVNGGSEWVEAARFTGEGQTEEWILERIPLPQLDKAASARVRFRLVTDGADARDGWYLDDLTLRAVLAVPAELIFDDGFESGDVSSW